MDRVGHKSAKNMRLLFKNFCRAPPTRSTRVGLTVSPLVCGDGGGGGY